MSIKFVCSKCGKVYHVSDKLAGKNGTCKVEGCGQRFTVPCLDTSTASPNTSQLKPKPKKSNWFKKYKRFAPIIAIIPIILFGGVLYLFSSTKAEAARLKNEISVLAEKAKKQFDEKQFDESITTNREIIKIARNIGFFTKVILGDEEFASELEHSEKSIKKTIQTKEQIAIENKRIAEAEKARLQKEQEERERLAEIERQKQEKWNKVVDLQTDNISKAMELSIKNKDPFSSKSILGKVIEVSPEAKNIKKAKNLMQTLEDKCRKILDSAIKLRDSKNENKETISNYLKKWQRNEFEKNRQMVESPLVFSIRFHGMMKKLVLITESGLFSNSFQYGKIKAIKYDFKAKTLLLSLLLECDYTVQESEAILYYFIAMKPEDAEILKAKLESGRDCINMIFQVQDYKITNESFWAGREKIDYSRFVITPKVLEWAIVPENDIKRGDDTNLSKKLQSKNNANEDNAEDNNVFNAIALVTKSHKETTNKCAEGRGLITYKNIPYNNVNVFIFNETLMEHEPQLSSNNIIVHYMKQAVKLAEKKHLIAYTSSRSTQRNGLPEKGVFDFGPLYPSENEDISTAGIFAIWENEDMVCVWVGKCELKYNKPQHMKTTFISLSDKEMVSQYKKKKRGQVFMNPLRPIIKMVQSR